MGEILCSRKHSDEGKVIVEVLLSKDEFRQLRGEMDHICLFAERVADIPSKLSLRGRNEATKYFLIPRQLRKQLSVRGEICCQRLEHEGKSVFIYVLDPYKTSKGSRLAAE